MVVATALLSWPSLGPSAALRVPVAMVTMHFAYALGFVRALAKKRPA